MTITATRSPFSVMEATRRMRAGEFFAVMKEMQQKGGDLVYMPSLPGVTNFNVFSPDIAYDILVQHTEHYQKPKLAKTMFKSSFGNGIFFSEGDFWRRQRKLAQPAFHHVRINAYANDMVAQTLRRLDRWQSGMTLDIDQEMHALTLVIVINVLFKTDVTNMTEQVAQGMKELGEVTARQITSVPQALLAMLPGWVPVPLNRRKQRAVDMINPILYQLIADHRKGGADKGDLLSMFLQSRDEETGEGMSDFQIRDELMTMFIAGHETSAVALSWALLEIARKPEIEAKLFAEVDSVLQGRAPTLDDLPNLPYTLQVIKETLRFYPPAIFISRQPLKPMDLGGKTVRPSDLINTVSVVIHHDERWYPAPERFDPERFTGDFEKNLPKCAYIPFGTGPRVCIGNGFAMLEMQLVLATLIQRFRFVLLPETEPVKPTFNITLGFQDPLKMQVIAR